MPVRVSIVGEGSNELGRFDGAGSRGRGVLEALLTRMCPTGWVCDGKLEWRRIRKYAAGSSRGRSAHGDYKNVLGLVLTAHENGAEVVVFSRDIDADLDREDAIRDALQWVETRSGWPIEVIGGVAKPAVEGWILALLGMSDTDGMSRKRTLDELSAHPVQAKNTDDYVNVVENAALGAATGYGLRPGTESLRSWLERAETVLARCVVGVVPTTP